MTKSELYQWMSDPSLLTRASLAELRQMTDDYPYCHAVKILYLKNLAALEDVRLDKELKKMAIHIPDRKRLFLLLNPQFALKSIAATTTNKTATPVKEPVTRHREATSLTVNPADYVNWLEENADDLPESNNANEQFRYQELIDSLLENKKNQHTSPPATSLNDEFDDILPEEQLATPSIDDSYFTETLARVYIRQKKYDKALEIIRSLNAKYPEKNIYFADQIRYLEKIINLK
ncbi:MAG: hypothetical protein LBR49_04915 [Tannerella sp.]|jgi:hypothetical protein|nr:hypothetical protein [Tannerella sp.]